MRKTTSIVYTVAALLVAAGSADAQPAADTAPPTLSRHGPIHPNRYSYGALKRGIHNEITTNNWSGYATANFETGIARYTQTSASWIVPGASYVPFSGATASTWEESSAWIGIGGFCENSGCTAVDNTLVQMGTDSDVSATGSTYYYAWYEMLPASSFMIPYAIGPGDYITASLTCTANCSAASVQTWQLAMSDIPASGSGRATWQWSATFSYQTTMLSAEWIEEAPWLNTILPLSDYQTVSFASMTANGANPNLSLATNGIQMTDPSGQTSNPATPAGGNAFSACWGYGSMTPCSTLAIVPPAGGSTGGGGTGGGGSGGGRKKK